MSLGGHAAVNHCGVFRSYGSYLQPWFQKKLGCRVQHK